MPKKGKKGKGGGKKGKGKKGGKKSGGKKGDKKKLKEESALRLAQRNAVVWEARVEVAEKTRNELRTVAHQLANDNSELKDLMHKTERDTIDVITHLKKQDQTKEDEIHKLQEELKESKRQHRDEKAAIIQDLSHQIEKMEGQLEQKNQDIQMMQNELKMVKEFRKKRQQMQRELDEIKDALFYANKEHKDTLAKLEQKFFEEKMRLQQEANQKIAELAERAHVEAISNLDETTRSVYKENVRLSEALAYHMKEGEKLKIKLDKLSTVHQDLKDDSASAEGLVREKVAEAQKLRAQSRQQEEKIELLEKGLNTLRREFTAECRMQQERSQAEMAGSAAELQRLRRLLELRSQELSKVRKLARSVLTQRSDLERFFLESLDIVRNEIASNQTMYRKEAQQIYTKQMLLAHAGRATFPPVRTFASGDRSTNSVYADLTAAEKFYQSEGQIDVADLTWEQRERVLRHLFARMNGNSPALTHAREMRLEDVEEPSDTFLTQLGEEHLALPPIVDPGSSTSLSQAYT